MDCSREMALLKTSISLIVGNNGVVSIPNPNMILLTHSQGQHSFRIYEKNPGQYSLLDSQGGFYDGMWQWDIVDFLKKLFLR